MIALARDVKTLIQWLNHDVLELTGPALKDRQALYDFVVGTPAQGRDGR